MEEKDRPPFLQFWGGCGTIGGNKILLMASTGKGIFLDFGYTFALDRQYFNEYMGLRGFSKIYDGIQMQELPPPRDHLAGLYAEEGFDY